MNGPGTILILYYSRKGQTEALARQVARGVESAGATAQLRTVPPVSPVSAATAPPVPSAGPPYVELDELTGCDGLEKMVRANVAAAPALIDRALDAVRVGWPVGVPLPEPAKDLVRRLIMEAVRECAESQGFGPRPLAGLRVVAIEALERRRART